MRFPEFTEPWERYKVSDILDFYSTNSLSWEQLEFTDGELRNLHYGMIHVGLPTLLNMKESKLPTIKDGNEPRSYTLCINGDVAFADASEDTNDVARAIELVETDGQKVVFGLHTIHGRDNKGLTEVGFKGYLFSSRVFHDQIKRIAQGTKVFSISNKNFSECFVGIPSKAEQTKIARLLSLLDRRIAVQSKLIEDLQQLKSAISTIIFSNLNYEIVKLGDICSITTGKLDANAMVDNGVYPFFTCAEQIYKIDTYSFDSEALLISGNGANVGYIHYYKGKFNAYQRTYVLSDFQVNIIYVKYFLDKYLHNRIEQEKNTGNTPYILMSTLSEMKINIPKSEQQNKIIEILTSISNKIEIEQQLLIRINLQKQYLLKVMFT